MKPFTIVLTALLCLAYAAFTYASDPVDYTDPSQVVKAFCQTEFDGVPDQDQRDLLVKYSKRRNEAHLKDYNMKASWLDTTVDKLILVSRYEIGSVSVHGDSGVASVVYQQLARTEGEGIYDRTFIRDVQPNQLVRLKLVFDGKRWWVYNPDVPRVSNEYLKSESKEIYQRYLDREKKSGLSPLEARSFKKLRENIEVLENL